MLCFVFLQVSVYKVSHDLGYDIDTYEDDKNLAQNLELCTLRLGSQQHVLE